MESYLTASRNEDFFNAFLNTINCFPHIPNREAIRIAIHSPARSFYISYRQAIYYINRLEKKQNIALKRSSDKYMCIMSIYSMATAYAIKHKTTLQRAVAIIIDSPAPRFYINRSTAYAIIAAQSKK